MNTNKRLDLDDVRVRLEEVTRELARLDEQRAALRRIRDGYQALLDLGPPPATPQAGEDG